MVNPQFEAARLRLKAIIRELEGSMVNETVCERGNVMRLRVSEGKHGRKVTVASRRLPKGSWLTVVRKAFKHCLIAMRLKF